MPRKRRKLWLERVDLTDAAYMIDKNVRFAETTGRGVVLLWTLDEDRDVLIVYLTPREAKKVVQGYLDGDGGLLETVRSDLKHPQALMWRRDLGLTPVLIPAGGPEESFVLELDQAIERLANEPLMRPARDAQTFEVPQTFVRSVARSADLDLSSMVPSL